MDNKIRLYYLLNDILNKFMSDFEIKKYELKNIFERFMISSINNYRFDYNFSIDSPEIVLFIQELSSKAKYKKRKISINSYISENLILPLNNYKKFFVENISKLKKQKIIIIGNTANYLDISIEIEPNRLRYLMQDQESLKKVLLNYSLIFNGGQQWSVNYEIYKFLYKNYNMRYEGFASPLNSKMLYFDDTHFCSLFKEDEEIYGSLGSFLEVDILKYGGTWSINPPFIDKLMLSAAEKVVDTYHTAITSKKHITMFVNLIGWSDGLAHIFLEKTKSYKKKYLINTKKGFYQNNKGEYLKLEINVLLYIFDTRERNYQDFENFLKKYCDFDDVTFKETYW